MGKYNEAVFFPVKCKNTNKMFYARYDFAADDRWVLTYGVPEAKMSGEYSAGSNKRKKVDVANSRTGPQYACPYCGNTGYVKCGKCGELTCYDSSGRFVCMHCGHSGEVSGVIQSADGKSGKAQ